MAFSPSEFRSFKLEKKEQINHNTALFRFELPEKTQRADLPVSSCVLFRFVKVNEDGKEEEIIRPYTNTSPEEAEGYIEFVIKDYPQGNMSRYVHSLNIGDHIDIKGPFVKYDWNSKPVKHVGLVSAGTGITPNLQLLRNVFKNDNTAGKDSKFTLIYANVSEEDILFKEELDALAKEYPDRFKVVYVLEKAPENWTQPVGYVTADLLKKEIPAPDTESLIVFVCGPPPFMEAVSGDKNPDKSQGTLRGFFKDLGYKQENIYKL